MAKPPIKRLKKELSLFNIYAIATGATVSSGFFLLPGMAFAQAGPAMILSYILAVLPLIPGIFSLVELSTAMPRSGGIYYFLDRSLGPLIGTIGGMGVWLVVILKTVFALVGIGAYLQLFLPDVPMLPIAIALAIFFGAINLFGARKSGIFQAIMVFGLLAILSWFVGAGVQKIDYFHFSGFFDKGFESVFATAGLLCVSYVGLTQIASVAEEIKNPERNIPLGVFLALGTAIIVYIIGSFVMIGVVPPHILQGSLTPAAETGRILGGRLGAVAITTAAVMAFASVANAGILSASRYPLALSRDHLLPGFLRTLNKKSVPIFSIFLTVIVILLMLVSLDATKIAKLASGFQLFIFAFASLAVIVMRESHITSYDPGYRSPFYPWLHILGIVAPFWFLIEMGWLPLLTIFSLSAFGAIWYYYYGRSRISRGGAIYHIFARLGEKRYAGLDRELRGILKEKGLRADDPFDSMVIRADVLDLDDADDFVEISLQASELLADKLNADAADLATKFLQGTRIGATPVSHGSALPHIHLPGLHHPEIVLVRARKGVKIDLVQEFWGDHLPDEPVFALFFMAGPEKNPRQHLRILAQIAECVDSENFMRDWMLAKTKIELKEILLRDEHFVSVRIQQHTETNALIGQKLKEIKWPADILIALIHRDNEIIIPHGSTVLENQDRLTIIGEPAEIKKIRKVYKLFEIGVQK